MTKLSYILYLAKETNLVQVSVKDASKVYANAIGELKYASTIFIKGGKTDIDKLKEVLTYHRNEIMKIYMPQTGMYEGKIEIDV